MEGGTHSSCEMKKSRVQRPERPQHIGGSRSGSKKQDPHPCTSSQRKKRLSSRVPQKELLSNQARLSLRSLTPSLPPPLPLLPPTNLDVPLGRLRLRLLPQRLRHTRRLPSHRRPRLLRRTQHEGGVPRGNVDAPAGRELVGEAAAVERRAVGVDAVRDDLEHVGRGVEWEAEEHRDEVVHCASGGGGESQFSKAGEREEGKKKEGTYCSERPIPSKPHGTTS